MPVLDRETYFNRVHDRIGNDTSEEALSFLEDMTDTFNDLEKKSRGTGEDWKQKYDELDKTWRERYRHRFMTSDGGYPPLEKEEDETKVKEVEIKDLFTNK